MVRAKLAVLMLVIIGALVTVSYDLSDKIRTRLAEDSLDKLSASNDVVRLADTVIDYSLMHEAEEAASLPAVIAGFRCPTSQAEFEEAIRLRPDPDYQPPPNATGDEIVPEVSGTDCTATRHPSVRNAIAQWSRTRQADRDDGRELRLTERAVGAAVAEAPDLLIAIDLDGTVVARVGFDKDDWQGADAPRMAYDAVSRTIVGEPQRDVILWREDATAQLELAQIGVAPIVVDGEVIGSLMVGHFLDNNVAEDVASPLVDVDVVYYFRDGNDVSFAGTTRNSPQFLTELGLASFRAMGMDAAFTGVEKGFAEVVADIPGTPWQFEVDGIRYNTISSTVSSDVDGTSGFLVISSMSRATLPVDSNTVLLPALGLLLGVLGILAMLVVVRQYDQPMGEISRGIQEVIAGNRDYMWEVDEKSHMGEFAHSLNIMSARLQGKKDPDSDDTAGTEDWAAMAGGRPAAAKKPAGIGGLGGLRGRAATEDDDEA
ncbi:MAG: hypothetical protein ACI81R_001128 [Bradymonadia bacterium]|jgi:hypothetical protein